MLDIEQVRLFFLKAMAEGWARGAEEIRLVSLNGFRAIPFQEGYLTLLDYYYVHPVSAKSVGTTTIWYDGAPVWSMNYGGFYRKEAIVCLKHALLKTYREPVFIGGRGPVSHMEGKLFYSNKVIANDFANFRGREEIVDSTLNTKLGYHDYWGMSLI